MRWPWISRAKAELEVDALHATLNGVLEQLDGAKERETYWRLRAEKLTDAALARAGAIHEPTMVERKVERDISAGAFAGMAVREIDSTADRMTRPAN